MNIYISSSWKNRDRVRKLAIALREAGHDVYDFTDPSCRQTPEIPPEKFPEEFDPDKHVYREYLDVPEWKAAVQCNRQALAKCDAVALLLPCGNDGHADWALAVGMRKLSAVVGSPRKGERTPSHWWADILLDKDEDFISWISSISRDYDPTHKDGSVEVTLPSKLGLPSMNIPALDVLANKLASKLILDLPKNGNECDHGVVFDEVKAKGLSSEEVKRLYPRLGGVCPKGCGYVGIYYASMAHYICGDW